MVTPTGRTKLAIDLETPSSLVTCFRVTGSVAALELVVRATSWAGRIAFIKAGIRIPAKMRINRG